MTPLIPSLSTVLISAIYCFWQAYTRQVERKRQRQLRERVAYMLWVMARRVA